MMDRILASTPLSVTNRVLRCPRLLDLLIRSLPGPGKRCARYNV